MKLTSRLFFLLLLLVRTNVVCAYVNEPLVLSPDDAKNTAKTEVLIFYANETAPVGAELENYETIISWLESGNTPAADKIVGQLRRDLVECRQVIDREIAENKTLFAGLRRDGGKCLVVFTNRLARENKFLTLCAGESDFETHDILFPPGDYYITANNPLATEAGFTAALEATAKRFDPKEYVFILLTKSHGNPQMAFTPRLIVRHEQETRESILAKVEGESFAPTENEPPRIGTAKAGYFQVVKQAGDDLGMFFLLIFMESCQSGPGLPETRELPTNIGLLFTTKETGAQYSCIRWEEVVTNDRTISDGMERFLREFGRNYGCDEGKTAGWFDWRYLYFLPLLLCFVMVLYKGVGRFFATP